MTKQPAELIAVLSIYFNKTRW